MLGNSLPRIAVGLDSLPRVECDGGPVRVELPQSNPRVPMSPLIGSGRSAIGVEREVGGP